MILRRLAFLGFALAMVLVSGKSWAADACCAPGAQAGSKPAEGVLSQDLAAQDRVAGSIASELNQKLGRKDVIPQALSNLEAKDGTATFQFEGKPYRASYHVHTQMAASPDGGAQIEERVIEIRKVEPVV